VSFSSLSIAFRAENRLALARSSPALRHIRLLPGTGEYRPRLEVPARIPIDAIAPVEQPQSSKNPLFRYWMKGRDAAQVEIIGGLRRGWRAAGGRSRLPAMPARSRRLR